MGSAASAVIVIVPSLLVGEGISMRAEPAALLPYPTQEIEITAFVGLRDVVLEQPRVPAVGPFMRRMRFVGCGALLQYRVVEHQFDRALRPVKTDAIAREHQRDVTAVGRLPRDVH